MITKEVPTRLCGAMDTRSAFCKVGTAREMAEQLKESLAMDGLKGVILYAPSTCDLDGLAREMKGGLCVPMFGCTTAGAIGPGGWSDGVVATALGGDIVFEVFSIDLDSRAEGVAKCAARVREIVEEDPASHTVCVVLHDGLSGCEESLNSELQLALGPTPLIGGSAGDDLAFRETRVLAGEAFAGKRSGVLVLSTRTPVHLFKFQHFEPGGKPIVITQANREARTVSEIDGLPAVEAYCEITGAIASDLGPKYFANHPIVVELDGDAYVRSIQRIESDGSIKLFCAIEEGVVCTIGRALDPLDAAKKAMAGVSKSVGAPQLTLGFDCILRALEARDKAFAAQLEATYKDNQVIGFHTYGETIYGLHINQTFAGLAFGRNS